MNKDHKSILLTGASGFAGSHMLKCLVENTDSYIYCPVTYNHGGHKKRIESIVPDIFKNRYTLLNHDLAIHKLGDTMFDSEINMIINFASESHVDRAIDTPGEFVSNNVNLMTNLLEFARKTKSHPKFIHISTDEVYGDLEANVDNSEYLRPQLPSNPYSASKSAQESLAIAYYKTYNMDISIINSTNMLGEGQNQEKYVPKVIQYILNNKEINVDTDVMGNMGSRKYIYVGDVANAVLLISKFDSYAKSKLPEKFHISGSQEISNYDIVRIISDILSITPKTIIAPSPRNGYDLRYELSSDKLLKLGWKEKITIATRLKEIVNWTIAHPEWLKIDYNS